MSLFSIHLDVSLCAKFTDTSIMLMWIATHPSRPAVTVCVYPYHIKIDILSAREAQSSL